MPWLLERELPVSALARSQSGGVVLFVKNPPASAGDVRDAGSIPGLGRAPWRRAWKPAPVFLLGKSYGQRSLVGYSPQGDKESDTTEMT